MQCAGSRSVEGEGRREPRGRWWRVGGRCGAPPGHLPGSRRGRPTRPAITPGEPHGGRPADGHWVRQRCGSSRAGWAATRRGLPLDADVAARPILQVPDELDQAAVDHLRIAPLAVEGRRRGEVLGHGADEGRDSLDLAARRPELGPLLVAAAAEDDRVLSGDGPGAAGIGFVVPRGDEVVGCLSHSVERQEVARDDLPRGWPAWWSTVSGWACDDMVGSC